MTGLTVMKSLGSRVGYDLELLIFFYHEPDVSQGAYAEYIVVNETHLIHKPSKLSWAEAASIPEVFLTGKDVPLLRANMDSDCFQPTRVFMFTDGSKRLKAF